MPRCAALAFSSAFRPCSGSRWLWPAGSAGCGSGPSLNAVASALRRPPAFCQYQTTLHSSCPTHNSACTRCSFSRQSWPWGAPSWSSSRSRFALASASSQQRFFGGPSASYPWPLDVPIRNTESRSAAVATANQRKIVPRIAYPRLIPRHPAQQHADVPLPADEDGKMGRESRTNFPSLLPAAMLGQTVGAVQPLLTSVLGLKP